MSDGCASELAIDRLVAGELSAAEAFATRGHTTTCARCGLLLADAVATAAAFAADPRPLRLPPAPNRARRRVALAAGVFAAAASALVLIPTRGGRPTPEATRIKGRPILGFFVSHAGEVRRGGPGERLAPGDQLQLYTTTPEPGWVAVVSVDGAGVRSVYLAPRPIAVGREQLVPLSIVLDPTPGVETVTGIFCPQPFTVDHQAEPPADCTTDRFTFHKELP